jgi:hypothetical protein
VSSASLTEDHTDTAAKIHISRRIFSFPVMLSGLLAMLAVVTVRGRFDDPDLWWHLKTGEVIWKTHTIPATDLFSFTTNHHAWIDHEWLSQLIIFGVYRLGGYSGLMLWLCCCTAALLIGGYALCALYSGNAKVALVGALTVWLFGTVGFAIRPHMIGYLLLLVELALLHMGRTRNPRWFLGLPPLFALWVNCHGSFFLGIVIAGITLFSSYFNFQWGSLAATRWDPRTRRTLIMAFSLSVAALFTNPVGVKLVLYPLQTLLVPSIGLAQVIEWQPLQLGDARSLAFWMSLGCIFLLVIIRRTELRWLELLMLVFAAWLAASHQRMLFVYGILAAPVLSRLLSDTWDNYSVERDRPIPNAVLIVATLLIIFRTLPSHANLTTQVEENSPVKAVEFIKTHHISGPMLNEWVDGGYLIWAMPEHPDFIDGRADVFEWTGVLAEFQNWTQLQSDPNVLLDKYRIGFCLLNRHSPMATVMSLLKNWQMAYQDDHSVIFTRTAPADAPTSSDPSKN